MSSGQRVGVVPWVTFCSECDFIGDIDLIVDLETHQTFWTCRECNTDHEGSIYDMEPS